MDTPLHKQSTPREALPIARPNLTPPKKRSGATLGKNGASQLVDAILKNLLPAPTSIKKPETEI